MLPRVPLTRRLKSFSTVAMMLTALLVGSPAGAAKLFTVDFNGNDMNDLDGSDDLPINFVSSAGNVSGFIRAVDITDVGRAALTDDIDTYVDFLGNFPGGGDFTVTDTLIFDVVLNAGSAPIDEIGVAVASDPTALNPDGAGYLDPCTPGIPLGCRDNVPVGQVPTAGVVAPAISLSPAFAPFPGAALFSFAKGTASPGNIEGGETTVRLFVSWADTGPGSPLNRIGQQAIFMISSGTNQDFFTDIVPEPTTGSLLGLGLIGLGLARNRRRAGGQPENRDGSV